MPQRNRFCSVANCFNSVHTSPELSFFCFPKREKECIQWLKLTGREDLTENAAQVNKSRYYVCGGHFELDQFYNVRKRSRLIPTARPSIFPTKPSGSALHPFSKSSEIGKSTEKCTYPVMEVTSPSRFKARRKTLRKPYREKRSGSFILREKIIKLPKEDKRIGGRSMSAIFRQKVRTAGNRFCSAAKCFNTVLTSPHLRFHPHPKDEDLCIQWFKLAGREDLVENIKRAINTHYLLCGDHFEPSQFYDPDVRTTLLPTAMPSIFSSELSGSALEPFSQTLKNVLRKPHMKKPLQQQQPGQAEPGNEMLMRDDSGPYPYADDMEVELLSNVCVKLEVEDEIIIEPSLGSETLPMDEYIVPDPALMKQETKVQENSNTCYSSDETFLRPPPLFHGENKDKD